MPHQICHAHCPKGGWGWLAAVIAALVVVLLGARAAAPALGRLVHEVLVWATVAVTGSGVAAIGGYVAVSATQDRRRRADAARPIPQGAPGPRRSQGGSQPRVQAPRQRRGQ